MKLSSGIEVTANADQIKYFEGLAEKAAEKLRGLPHGASLAKRLAATNRYAYAVRCHQEAMTDKKWLRQPEQEHHDRT